MTINISIQIPNLSHKESNPKINNVAKCMVEAINESLKKALIDLGPDGIVTTTTPTKTTLEIIEEALNIGLEKMEDLPKEKKEKIQRYFERLAAKDNALKYI